ncbi:hypothetical protein CYMTET_35084 [Cymbomonas tetramitiformis]|uniref:Uncharacterized protein n=1 Tax=Cymbomonas tetramitiformis TaxID=36881 RepID=A0AAE0KP91_9CHLO|nr:hypothetical protein CYMTET_35084 [Cymbomonas tetramitiformis]
MKISANVQKPVSTTYARLSACSLGRPRGPSEATPQKKTCTEPTARQLHPRRSCRISCSSQPDSSADNNPIELTQDARDFRARLVAREKGLTGDSLAEEQGWVYETPLIEQGVVILGGTEQQFGFALRQQYFHKSVILVLSHDEQFTRGIILNRPTAKTLEGWKVWLGGDVQEGGLFREKTSEALPPAEITCLHRLQSEEALELSTEVIKGISWCGFEAAKALVASGSAVQEDFWVFVGYAGWGPEQLQGELDRQSWYLAAADSTVLLDSLLSLASDPTSLPKVNASGQLEPGGDGIDTWNRLMKSIGKETQVAPPPSLAGELSDSEFEDVMLREWVRTRLGSAGPGGPSALELLQSSLDGASAAAAVAAGTLLMSEAPSQFVLEQQYLHKSLVLLLQCAPDATLGVILNRPSDSLAQVSSPDAEKEPSRRLMFGGPAMSSTSFLLHRKPDLMELESTGTVQLGESGIFLSANILASTFDSGLVTLGDFLIVSGLVAWQGAELQDSLMAGKLRPIDPDQVPWDKVWDLGDGSVEPEDGTAVWEEISSGVHSTDEMGQVDAGHALARFEQNKVADKALTMWMDFFLR